MSDMITPEQAGKLLDEVAQNQPRVCMAWCLKSAEDCFCYKASIARNALNDAAPDLARTVIALHAARADAAAIREAGADEEARGLNLAIERVTAFLSRTDDAAHQLAVDAMLEDMQNDNYEAEIRLYRQVIFALIDSPGKEVI